VAAHTAAADDFLDVTQEAFPAFDRPLRRPKIRLVENEVQRLLVRLVQRFGERRHEAPARGIAAEFGEVDNARQSRAGDELAELRRHLGGDRHVGVFAAKHHDRIAGFAAVGAGAHPHQTPSGSMIRHPRAAVEQPFDEPLGRVGLARPGRADDRNPVIERLKGKHTGQHLPAGSGRRLAINGE
jgi:hypothetical protein